MIANIHPYYDVYVSEDDMSLWKIVMEGVNCLPPNTLLIFSLQKVHMQGRHFRCCSISVNRILWKDREVDLLLQSCIPILPNKGVFATVFLTVGTWFNVGLIIGNWTSDTSCVDVLNSIWGLLLVPDLEDPA